MNATIRYILGRLAERSTFAGIGALAVLLGLHVTDVQLGAAIDAIVGLSGFLLVVIPTGGGTPTDPAAPIATPGSSLAKALLPLAVAAGGALMLQACAELASSGSAVSTDASTACATLAWGVPLAQALADGTLNAADQTIINDAATALAAGCNGSDASALSRAEAAATALVAVLYPPATASATPAASQ